jgi:hypothetical protein
MLLFFTLVCTHDAPSTSRKKKKQFKEYLISHSLGVNMDMESIWSFLLEKWLLTCEILYVCGELIGTFNLWLLLLLFPFLACKFMQCSNNALASQFTITETGLYYGWKVILEGCNAATCKLQTAKVGIGTGPQEDSDNS